MSSGSPMRPSGVPASMADPQLVGLHHDVEGRGGHRADGDGVDPDPRGEVGGGQPGVVGQRALGRAVGQVAPSRQAAHGRRDVDHRAAAALEHQRDRRAEQGVGGGHVEVEGLLETAGEVSMNGRGIAPPTLFTTRSSRPNAVPGPVDQGGHGVEVVEVGGHHHRPPPGALDPARPPPPAGRWSGPR